MKRPIRRDWWAEDEAVVMCELDGCGCPIQRTPTGTVADGMALHVAMVHTGQRPVSLTDRKAGAR